jgi:hypothetical protein
LPAADELEPVENLGVIGAIAVRVAVWLRNQTTALVKTKGLRGKPHC